MIFFPRFISFDFYIGQVRRARRARDVHAAGCLGVLDRADATSNAGIAGEGGRQVIQELCVSILRERHGAGASELTVS